MNQLLQDVLSGQTDYKTILVYDVSRWGRFQNPDEAAAYEFICAKAGVPVHYCAEHYQATMCEFLVAGHFGRHVRRMRELYAGRLTALRD